MSELRLQVPLAELMVLKTGPFGSALHKSDYVRGGTPVVNPMHIVKGKIVPGDDARIGEEVLSRLKEFTLVQGDVILGRRGEMGRCAVVGSREAGWLCGTGSLILRQRGALEPRYLQRFLSSPEIVRRLEGDSVGSTMVNLNQGILHGLEVPVPPLREQKRIADKLDALLARVDACRGRLDRVPAILKRFRQSVLAAATSGELTREWREARGTDLSEWETTTIGELIHGKPRNGYSPRAVEHPTAVKSLTLTATTTGRFRGEYSKYIDEEIPADSHLWLQPGDILIQRANTLEYVGVSAIFDGPPNTFIYPDLMMKCQPNARVGTAFLHLLLSSEPVRTYFRDNATGTAGNMPKINQQTVITAPALLPPLEEQKEIVRRMEALMPFADELEQRCATSRKRVDKLTPSLLAKAFRGELVPQDPSDEPASVLLARMKGAEPVGAKKRKGKSAKA